MIVLSAVLVLVGLALLIAGLVSTGLALIYASLGVTVVAAILLLLGVRMSPSKRGGETPSAVTAVHEKPASRQAPAASDEKTGELKLEPEPASAVSGGATHAPGTVVVVSGRPRYHRAECRFLANVGDEAEDISAEEARELGFTPCGVCKPDDQQGRAADKADAKAAAGRTAASTTATTAEGTPRDTSSPPKTDRVPEPPRPVGAVTMDKSTLATTDSVGADSAAAPTVATAPDTAPGVPKVPAKKIAAKKAAAKKTAVRKAPLAKVAKKTPATKVPANKTAVAKKMPTKKAAVTKAPAKKAAPATKAAVKKASGRPTSRG